ncbi:MAG: cysteine peptidase family C39 domain-containing protein, partial [bacterium]
EIMVRVREGRWLMEHDPGSSFRCGPYALEHIFAFSQPGVGPNRQLAQARSTTQGTSLLQMRDLARQAGLDLRMAHRSGNATIPLPAMVHWKSGHFAALLESSGDLYRAEDATFDGSFWVSRDALKDEASGYFLVPGTELPAGCESHRERRRPDSLNQATVAWA